MLLPFPVRRTLGARRDLDIIVFHSCTGWMAGGAVKARRVIAFVPRPSAARMVSG